MLSFSIGFQDLELLLDSQLCFHPSSHSNTLLHPISVVQLYLPQEKIAQAPFESHWTWNYVDKNSSHTLMSLMFAGCIIRVVVIMHDFLPDFLKIASIILSKITNQRQL